MKLNLLPTHVSKEKQNRVAIVLSVLLAGLGIAAAVYMVIVPAARLKQVDEMVATETASHQNLQQRSAQADTIIQRATILLRNISLADSMLKHSAAYPALYNDIKPYIPSFFRVHTMSAAPSGDMTVVTMTGVIKTYQQYADLMLALLKNPEAVSVTRSGYQHVDPRVPALTPEDQRGRAVRSGEGPIPDDPLDRLDYFIGQGRVTGFTGTGGFGTTDTGARHAMPDWSEITITYVVRRNVQTPDPRATLALQTGTPQQAPGTNPGTPATNPVPGNTGGPGPRPDGE
jgi:hypothetical protein